MSRASEHILYSGATQVGKTTAVRRRLSRAPRWIALDPEGEYDDLPGVTVCRAWNEGHGEPGPYARDQVTRLAQPGAEVRIALTADRPADHLACAAALFAVHDTHDVEPTALVMEEAWKLARGQSLPPELARIYFSSLKRGIFGVTVTQNVQQVPKQIRQSSRARIFFRLDADPPQGVARRIRDEDLEALGELRTLERNGDEEATRHVPDREPPGHYVTDPPELDLDELWQRNIEGV